MKPCKTCGSTDRNALGRCKPCRIKAQAKYRANNKDAIAAYNIKTKTRKAAYNKAKYEANPEEKKAREKKRYFDNLEKFRQYHKEYRNKNRERIAAYQAKAYRDNPEPKKQREAKRYIANPEPSKTRMLKWAKDNPEICRIRGANRRTKLKSIGVLSKNLSKKLFTLQKGKCACCGKPLGNNYHLDHRMPIALGGLNEDWNMQLLTATCNLQKSAKHPIEFMQSRGFLL